MADIFNNLLEQGITKRILYPGHGEIPEYGDGIGWQVTFQYKATKLDNTVVDDSRVPGNKPMELLLGKKFTFDVWEKCVRSMKLCEVSEFVVDKKHVEGYPIVSKSLRNIARSAKDPHRPVVPEKSHCCGMMSMTKQVLGYADLDALLANPEALIFTLELIKIASPGNYKREAWELNETEKLEAIKRLREEGNNLYRLQKFEDATERYSEALGMLEQLMLIEKPGDETWTALNKMQIPLLLNFCQCKLIAKEFYMVIEHCTTVLKYEPDNVKGLFRRGKAHIGAWNLDEAKTDLERAMEIDGSVVNDARKQLRILEEVKRKRNAEDKHRMQGKLFG